jgi:hypothetical protein
MHHMSTLTTAMYKPLSIATSIADSCRRGFAGPDSGMVPMTVDRAGARGYFPVKNENPV